MGPALDRIDTLPGRQSEPRPAVQYAPLSACVLDDLSKDWTDLSADAVEPNPFLEPIFVVPALNLFQTAKSPGILTVRCGSLLIGLMILSRRIGYSGLPLPFVATHSHLHQFLGTPLVRNGFEDMFANALCYWLDRGPRWAQFLVLARQHTQGPVLAALRSRCSMRNRTFHEFERCERPMLMRDEQSKGCREGALSARSRKRLRAKRNGLGAQGKLRYEELAPGDRLDPWLDEFLDFELKGWKGTIGTAILNSPEETVFFKTAMGAFFDRRRLRISRLKAGERAVSYSIDMVADRALFAFKAAYDPTFKKFSPGVLLDYCSLESFHENPAYDWIDSCAAGEHPVLSGLWRDRRSISGVVIGRRNASSRLGLQTALTVQSIRRTLKWLRPRRPEAA